MRAPGIGPLLASVSLLALMLLFYQSGCVSDKNSAAVTTIQRLRDLSSILGATMKKDPTATPPANLSVFLAKATKLGLLTSSKYEDKLYERDGWQHSFHYELQGKGKIVIIRILSDGADGLSQDGEGDDLFVRITITEHGSHVQMKIPRNYGMGNPDLGIEVIN